jgi:hypothetical protein
MCLTPTLYNSWCYLNPQIFYVVEKSETHTYVNFFCKVYNFYGSIISTGNRKILEISFRFPVIEIVLFLAPERPKTSTVHPTAHSIGTRPFQPMINVSKRDTHYSPSPSVEIKNGLAVYSLLCMP